MEYFNIVLEQVCFFTTALAVGFISQRVGFITDEVISCMSRLIMKVILPILVVTVVATLCVSIGLGDSPDKVIIGNIMLLIPGLQLINALREMLHGDLMSGLLRMLESVILAASIAGGFALPVYFWNQIM